MKFTIQNGHGKTAGKGCAVAFFSFFALIGVLVTLGFVKATWDTVRTYQWVETPCEITEGGLVQREGSYELALAYRYQHEGRRHVGTRLRPDGNRFTDAGEAMRAATRYAPGRVLVCYINPKVPTESLLERGSLWLGLLVFFPLIFVAVGVGGVVAALRRKPAAAQAVSERVIKNRGGAMWAMRAFGLLFALVGLLVTWFIGVRPWLQVRDSQSWHEVPCRITHSEVTTHRSDKGGETYGLQIHYRYDFNGQEYFGSRYHFFENQNSNRGWREQVVRENPAGRERTCFVNPADPTDAVLVRETGGALWLALIPIVFVLVGLAVFLAGGKMKPQQLSAPGISANHAGIQALRAQPGGPVVLKTSASQGCGCAVLGFITLVWNGVVAGIFWSGKLDFVSGLFAAIFGLIGLGLLAGLFYALLSLFNPKPVITVSSAEVPLGGTIQLDWRFDGNVRRIQRLTLHLEAREEARYQRGTNSVTDRSIFVNELLFETRDTGSIASGSLKVSIPADSMHSFMATDNKILWHLRVHGEIARWPDVSGEYAITVLPLSTRSS